jgi:hypothetical protein
VRILVCGPEGTGKSLFLLSAAKIGPLAVADTEFGMHNYLIPHPSGAEKRFTLIEPAKKLLGIPLDQHPVIAWVQTNDLAKVKSFMQAASKDPEIVTLGVDSASILWDIASSAVTGAKERNEWNHVKQPLRMLQYLILASGKHYIFTAHLNKQFNENMTEVIGELPWSEKKDVHWGDLNLKLTFAGGATQPQGIVLKERSSGRVKKGSVIPNVSMETVLKLFGQQPKIVGTPLDPAEVAYRVDVAARREAPQTSKDVKVPE